MPFSWQFMYEQIISVKKIFAFFSFCVNFFNVPIEFVHNKENVMNSSMKQYSQILDNLI